MIIIIRTTRFIDGNSKSHTRDYLLRKTPQNTVDCEITELIVDHQNISVDLKSIFKKETQTFSSPTRWTSTFLADMAEDQKYTYCEIEIRSFALNQRVDKEFKIKLKKSESYNEFTKIKRFFDLFFDPTKQIESLKEGSSTIDIEFNDKQLMSIDVKETLKQMKDMKKDFQESAEKALSVIQENVFETMSSVSQRGRKRGLLSKIFRR